MQLGIFVAFCPIFGLMSNCVYLWSWGISFLKQSDCLLGSDRIEQFRLSSRGVCQIIDQHKSHDLSLIISFGNKLEECSVACDNVLQGHFVWVNKTLSHQNNLPSLLVIARQWKIYSTKILQITNFTKMFVLYPACNIFWKSLDWASQSNQDAKLDMHAL